MKPKSKSTTGQRAKSQAVRIEFHDGKAQEVCIAGSFNDWHPAVTPMLHLSHDRWAKELALPPGRYEYQFVVDGKWVCDPAAEKVPNPFGGFNSVLVVQPTESERKRQP